MSCDLEVNTDEIRQACSALSNAARYQSLPESLPEVAEVASSLHLADCHGSASVREALRLTIRRAEQGLDAAKRLTSMTLSTADRLTTAADAFDNVEQLCVSGY